MSQNILDLRRVPTGVTIQFAFLFYVATLTAVFLVYRFATASLGLEKTQAMSSGLSCVPVLWAAVLLLVGFTELAARRLNRLHAPRTADEQRAAARVMAVAGELGIAQPLVLIAPTYNARNAWVQGLRAPFLLVIEAGFAGKARRDPELFDAAVAHELAHVANGDARWLAISVALAAVLRWLIILSVGIPVADFVMHVVTFTVRVDLANTQNRFWLGDNAVRLALGYILPAIAAYLPFRLGYAHLMRRRELAADWLAAISGRALALARLLAVHQSPRRLDLRIGHLFEIRVGISQRIHILRHPERLNAAGWADYLWIGVGSGLIFSAIGELNFLGAMGSKLLDNSQLKTEQIFKEYIPELFTLITREPLVAIFALIVQCGMVVVFVSLPVTATPGMLAEHGRPWVVRAVAQALLMVCGVHLGRLSWSGNIQDYGPWNANASILETAGLSETDISADIGALIAAVFLSIWATRLITGWWVRGRGTHAGGSIGLSIATFVGIYFSSNWALVMFIGLRDVVGGAEGEQLDTVAVITTAATLPLLVALATIRFAIGGRATIAPAWLNLPHSVCGPPIPSPLAPSPRPDMGWRRPGVPLRRLSALLRLLPLAVLFGFLSAAVQVYKSWFLVVAAVPATSALAGVTAEVEAGVVARLRGLSGMRETYRPALLVQAAAELDRSIAGMLGRAVDPVVGWLTVALDKPRGYRVQIVVTGTAAQPSASAMVSTAAATLALLPSITGDADGMAAGITAGVQRLIFPLADAMSLRTTDPNAALRIVGDMLDQSHLPTEIIILAHNLRSVLLVKAGNPETAVEAAWATIRLAPDFPTAWRNLGDAQAELQRFDEAIASYLRGLAIAESNASLWNQLGVAHYRLKQVENAIVAFRRSIRANDKDPMVHENLALAMIESGRNFDGGQDHDDLCDIIGVLRVASRDESGFEETYRSLVALMREKRPCREKQSN